MFRLPVDPSQAAELARSPDLSREQLAALAASDLPFLREAAAAHPRATPDLLAELVPIDLSGDVTQRIAGALAANPSCPAPVLERLLQLLNPNLLDGSRRENLQFELLAISLLKHPSCPVDAGLAIVGRSSRALRSRMAEALTHPAFLQKLASDPSAEVSSRAKARLFPTGA